MNKKLTQIKLALCIATLAVSSTFVGCGKREKATGIGAVVGGGAGATVGGVAGGPVGAGIGAGVGVVAGGVVGNIVGKGKKKKENGNNKKSNVEK